MWDERQFAVKDNAQELKFPLRQELGYHLAARKVLGEFAGFTEVYAYSFRGRELESIGVSPVCKFIETLLEVTLNNMYML